MRAGSLLLFPHGQSRMFVVVSVAVALALLLALLAFAGTIGVGIDGSMPVENELIGPFRWGQAVA